MTETSLIPAGSESLPTQMGDDKALDKLASTGYLSRIQVMDKGSKAVVDDKIKQGVWALIKGESVIDLTDSFEGLVLARRPKAMRFGNDVTSVYDPNDPEFQKIEQMSEVADSQCSFGTSYLGWVRAHREFVELFCNSKTSRRASSELNTILKRWNNKEIPNPVVTFKTNKIDNGRYKWWGPVFVASSTPLSEMPTFEDMKEQVIKFINPPKNGKETISKKVESRG